VGFLPSRCLATIRRFEVFTAVVMKSFIFWNMTPCRPLSLTDVSEEHVASIFRVEEIGSAKPESKQVASYPRR
jgi:hypothetical protein